MTRAALAHRRFLSAYFAALAGIAGVVVHADCPPGEGCDASAGPEWIGDERNPVAVPQGDFTLFADPVHGQKTGLFLDQRWNRKLIQPWCGGVRALDLFCHAGGWAFSAAVAGATEVIGVDSSESALSLARMGAERNGLGQVRFEKADVFDWLDAATGSQRGAEDGYGVIVCDPPAFAKNRKHVENALKGYLSLNYRCMKLLPVGGVLATCSCSHYVSVAEFETMLATAARNAGMRFRIAARGGQPADHPSLLGCPETDYLKCLVLQRLD